MIVSKRDMRVCEKRESLRQRGVRDEQMFVGWGVRERVREGETRGKNREHEVHIAAWQLCMPPTGEVMNEMHLFGWI